MRAHYPNPDWEALITSPEWQQAPLNRREEARKWFLKNVLLPEAVQKDPVIAKAVRTPEGLQKVAQNFYEATNPDMFTSTLEEVAKKTGAAVGRGLMEDVKLAGKAAKLGGEAAAESYGGLIMPRGGVRELLAQTQEKFGTTEQPVVSKEYIEQAKATEEEAQRHYQIIEKAINNTVDKVNRFIGTKTNAKLPATEPTSLPGKIALGFAEFAPQVPLFELVGGPAERLVGSGVMKVLPKIVGEDAASKLAEKWLFKQFIRGTEATAGAVPWSAVTGENLKQSIIGFVEARIGLGMLGDAFAKIKGKEKVDFDLSSPAKEYLNEAGLRTKDPAQAVGEAVKMAEASGEPHIADELRTKASRIADTLDKHIDEIKKEAPDETVLSDEGKGKLIEEAKKAYEVPPWMRTPEQEELAKAYEAGLDDFAEKEYEKTLTPEEKGELKQAEEKLVQESPEVATEIGIKPMETWQAAMEAMRQSREGGKIEEAPPAEAQPPQPVEAAKAEVAGGKAKEPWEMTREEFVAYKENLPVSKQAAMEASVGVPAGLTGGKRATALARAKEKWGGFSVEEVIHRQRIQQALSEGKPVPRHVLEEYKGEPWADEALKKTGGEDLTKQKQLLQMVEDIIATKKANREAVPQHLYDKYNELRALIERETPHPDVVYSQKVFGQPEATNIRPDKYGNLIPVKARSAEAIYRKMELAQKRIDELQRKLGKHKKLNIEDETILDLLRTETMPELQRMLKLLEGKSEPPTEVPSQTLLHGTTKEKAERLAKEHGAQVEPDELNPGQYKVVKLYAGLPVDLEELSKGALGKAARGIREIGGSLFNPFRLTEEGEETKRIYRGAKGTFNLWRNQLVAFYEPVKRVLDRQPEDVNFEFTMRLEENDITKADINELYPDLKEKEKERLLEWAKNRRQVMDWYWGALKKAGLIEDYVTNYMMHVYEFPEDVASHLGSRFASILKERKFATYREFFKWAQGEVKDYSKTLGGIGEEDFWKKVKPKFYNPVDIDLEYITNATNLLAFNKAVREAMNKGLIVRVEDPFQKPPGFEPLTVNNRLVKASPLLKDDAFAGKLYAERSLKKVLDNWASYGLWMRPDVFGDIYRGVRIINNNMNSVNLSFLNFFHATFTLHVLQARQIGSLVQNLLRLKLGKVAETLPRIVPGGHIAWAAKLFKEGGHLMDLVYGKRKPVTEADFEALKYMEYGNYNPRMDPYYEPGRWKEQLDKVIRTVKTGEGKAQAFNPVGLVGAIADASSAPLMREAIPRWKLAEFVNIVRENIERLQPETEAELRDICIKASDFVDNTLGQMQYDNLAWNRMLKDILFITLRSVGWNWGDIRVSIHAAEDLTKAINALFKGDLAEAKKYGLSDDLIFTISMPTAIALNGAAYMAVKGIKPKSWKDYLFWPTGEYNPDGTEQRINPASYLKDIVAPMYKSPKRILRDKLAPWLSTAIDLGWSNTDYYNRRIIETIQQDDVFKKIMTAATQAVEFIGKQWLPFSFTGYEQRRRAGASPIEALMAGAGYPPAPSYFSRTPAQNKIYEIFYDTKGPTTRRMAEDLELRRKIREEWRKNKKVPPELTREYIQKKGRTSYVRLIRSVIRNIPPDVAIYKELENTDKPLVLVKCATQEEFDKYWRHTGRTARALYLRMCKQKPGACKFTPGGMK